jgi:hypothetical protein
LRKSFRWIKDTCNLMVHGWRWIGDQTLFSQSRSSFFYNSGYAQLD